MSVERGEAVSCSLNQWHALWNVVRQRLAGIWAIYITPISVNKSDTSEHALCMPSRFCQPLSMPSRLFMAQHGLMQRKRVRVAVAGQWSSKNRP